MLRFILAGTLTVLALIILILAMYVQNSSVADLMFNLGAEVVGIAMTVAIVDWLIERNKLGEEALRLAWRMLHEIDQAVWVWQGGRQEFHLDELAALIDLIGEEDDPAESTQDLFVNLGRTASDSLRLNSKLLKHDKRLREALNHLTGLAQMRALKGKMPRTYVVDALRRSVDCLAGVTGQVIHTGTFGVARIFRDGSIEAQKDRFRGSLYGEFNSRPAPGSPRGSQDTV